MKKLRIFIYAATMVAFMACGGSADTPESITKALYSQLQNENYEKAMEIALKYADLSEMDEEYRSLSKDELIKVGAKRQKERYSEGIKTFEIEKVEIDEEGNNATVYLNIITKSDNEISHRERFYKKDDKWYVR
ncbi:MAG: DUF4878 domain-containing protein [Prevotellaceae bacterium]|jgi:hypothetical protein|nr:DUF4878 domain-containing protein [Prevotellaceae bacterium]